MDYQEKIIECMMEIIREERISQGYTYEDFSAKARLHRTTIPRYEKGTVIPTVLAALKMSDALGLNFSDIIKRAETKTSLSYKC